tara:strand:+ start:289 stop:696 length:408 start_codon:yes stop_codon:yes gene_type:complete
LKAITKMKNPLIPISWGELFDKITILQIKSEKILSPDSLKNIDKELKELRLIFDKAFAENLLALEFMEKLRQINFELWNIEDQIREKERKKAFDNEFIQLARSVYMKNDQRSVIKGKINKAFGSDLVEQKSYSKY